LTLSDDLQLKLLRAITKREWNQRLSYASLGKKLGVDEETVRVRLKRISESGFLQGWQLIINPHVIGLELASVIVDVNDPATSKERVVSQLKLIDGVIFIFNFFETSLRVAFYYQDEYDMMRRAILIQSICGSEAIQVIKHLSPKCEMKLRRTDWEILKTLRKDPRRNLTSISRELKLSTRTVTRRLGLLIENNTLYQMPIGNLKKSSGLIFYILILFEDSQNKKKIDEFLPETIPQLVFLDTNFQNYTAISILCKNFSESEQIIELVKEMGGVQSLSFWVLKEILPTHEWFDHEIEKHLGIV
jgi:DNA-binding Lrp family transcriptional regulator